MSQGDAQIAGEASFDANDPQSDEDGLGEPEELTRPSA